MIHFLTGALGALFSLTLFGFGYWLGSQDRGRRPPPGQQAEPVSRARLEEEQRAFAALQSYSPERAYGLVKEV